MCGKSKAIFKYGVCLSCYGSVEHNERLADEPPKQLGTFEQLGTEIGKLTDHKQEAYGDSFGKAGQVMRILYPNGITGEQMDDALAVVRTIDKLFRIATQKKAFGESPWRDVAGYGMLGDERSRGGNETNI